MSRTLLCTAAMVALLGLGGIEGLTSASAAEPGKAKATGKYIGASKCKNCHKSEKAGNQYGAWKRMKHSKTFEVLASAEAKKTAKKLGIADPQKSAKCLKCHVTAYDAPKKQRGRGLKHKDGVQCESCHGPGGKHLKARFAAAAEEDEDDEDDDEKEYEPLPEGEIITRPESAVCLECHNEESPTFKAFCLQERYREIAHLDPRKKRDGKALSHVSCDCTKECECKKGECRCAKSSKK